MALAEMGEDYAVQERDLYEPVENYPVLLPFACCPN
jgi:hypothetical protein